jgi:2-C-methyl-D-erythritol 4-phosphate cytidylyltransferase/2-C-methyl-D-erythritol 2,4-cyclodiphosphate synthase
MKHFAIIVAAGTGERMHAAVPKQYLPLNDLTVLEQAAHVFLKAPCIEKIVIVLAEDDAHFHALPLSGHSKVMTAIGGATRLESALNGLRALENLASPEDWIWEHDAARPCFTEKDFKQAFESVMGNPGKRQGFVLAYPAVDTLKSVDNHKCIERTIDRASIWQAATPQIFPYAFLFKALQETHEKKLAVTDSASAVGLLNGKIEILPCARQNIKITEPADLVLARFYLSHKREKYSMRIGHGMDVHAFKKGRDLILGGVHIPHHQGLEGHSDADVVIHALCDAMLGALALGDIGQHFPDTDPKYKGVDSRALLKQVNYLLESKHYSVHNADITIAAQAPKLAPYIIEMRQNLADDLGVALDQVSIKATTTEKLGYVGREEGISVEAVVLVKSTI